ncbi:MAG TPA: CRISPR-associated endoribonuclease Cas6 [Bacteroidia bacterium]|jgi:CRISPR-associated endoribonuclease Cas6|nr:CRISPR-associated endoribonuclease Cas6 [Bacteroidia bacterium]
MRIKVNFTKSTEDVPNNNSVVLEYLHRCLGRNNKYHDRISDYNISHLYGGVLCENRNFLTFPDGGYFVLSSMNTEFINNFLLGLMKNSDMKFGMKFSSVDNIEEKFYDGWNYFAVLSPFIIKKIYGKNDYSFMTLNGEYKRIDNKWELINTEDYNFEEVLKSYLINKISKIDASLDLSTFEIKIPKFYKGNLEHKHKVRKVVVKNVVNYANQCHLDILCSKKVAELLYNIGMGQSTGAGFGTIYKTESHHIYKSKTRPFNLENKKSELLAEVS